MQLNSFLRSLQVGTVLMVKGLVDYKCLFKLSELCIHKDIAFQIKQKQSFKIQNSQPCLEQPSTQQRANPLLC